MHVASYQHHISVERTLFVHWASAGNGLQCRDLGWSCSCVCLDTMGALYRCKGHVGSDLSLVDKSWGSRGKPLFITGVTQGCMCVSLCESNHWCKTMCVLMSTCGCMRPYLHHETIRNTSMWTIAFQCWETWQGTDKNYKYQGTGNEDQITNETHFMRNSQKCLSFVRRRKRGKDIED